MARAPFVSLEVSRSSLAVVTRALEQVDATLKAEGKTELKTLGELVEHDAEQLARGRILGVGSDWSQMRTGAFPSVVYVAPVQRGTKIPARKRKKFAQLMLTRAMRPALAARRAEVYERFQALTVKVAKAFNG